MTQKRNPNLSKSEALIESWKHRKDYKGYDRTKGSLYNTWRSIVYTKKGKQRGFPPHWTTFEAFSSDVGSGWSRGLVLTRKDTTMPYSKDNCLWANKGAETIYKLATLKYNEEVKTLVEWCAIYNLNYNGVRQRYYKGKNFTAEQILFGKRKGDKHTIHSLNELDRQQQRAKVSKMLSQYRNKDRRKGLLVEKPISIEQGLDLLSRACVYCGDTKRVGLDRIDNSKGHSIDNVVPCCYDCNIARSNNFTHDEMFVLGRTIKAIKDERRNNNHKK